jgi:hypothetical protein
MSLGFHSASLRGFSISVAPLTIRHKGEKQKNTFRVPETRISYWLISESVSDGAPAQMPSGGGNPVAIGRLDRPGNFWWREKQCEHRIPA